MAKSTVKVGRPKRYTQTLCNLICERIATHDIGLQKLCAIYDDMPDKITIRRWLFKYPEFSTQYAQAKKQQADLLAESIEDIAAETNTYVDMEGNTRYDTGFIADKRLRIDTRKWLAAKLLPRAYGDRIHHETKLNVISHEESLKQLDK